MNNTELTGLFTFLAGMAVWAWICAFTEPFAWWKFPATVSLLLLWMMFYLYLVYRD